MKQNTIETITDIAENLICIMLIAGLIYALATLLAAGTIYLLS